jgi:hypothetical protein
MEGDKMEHEISVSDKRYSGLFITLAGVAVLVGLKVY